MNAPDSGLVLSLAARYQGLSPDALKNVLNPLLVPIEALDKTVTKLAGEGHFRASFEVPLTPENEHILVPGRTGKFIPNSFLEGGPWREIAKGRIRSLDLERNVAIGEIYTGRGGKKSDLVQALEQLQENDLLEIDQFGASAKVLSGLVEYSLYKKLKDAGYKVRRMPEDMAKHLGIYLNYDFTAEKSNVLRKIEVKSLWGTNTDYARLIHSKTATHETSSCHFDTQDIFAVSLFLRTGNINDFAFARSVSRTEKPYGLPHAPRFPNYVNQNPLLNIGDGSWFSSIDEVWDLE